MPDDESRLRTQIETVLESELTAYRQHGRSDGSLGSFNVTMQRVIRDQEGNRTGWSPDLLSPEPEPNLISSRSASILLRLYSSLGTPSKAMFQNILKGVIDPQSPYQNLSYLAYYVLFRTGDRVEPLRLAVSGLVQDVQPNFGFGNTLAMAANTLTYEYDQFSSSELDGLVSVIGSFAGHDFGIRDKVREAKLRILESELSDVNPEINTDRDRVVSFWEEVFGSQSIPNLVAQIEELFNEGAFDDAKLATCLGRVRVLLIEALKELSSKLVESRQLSPLGANSLDADVINWFKQVGVLGTKEKKLIRAIYDLCSDEGSHAAVSRREYARVAKNMTYECLVMMIGLIPS